MSQPKRPAWKSISAWALFVGLVAAGLTADLWTKHAVFESVLAAQPDDPHPSREIIPGVLSLTLSTNSGVVFGIQPPRWGILLGSVLALLAIGYFFATTTAKDRLTHVALGLILAGALGNLYDRLLTHVQLPGRDPAVREVRDFIDFSDIGYPWIFNVADVLLVLGVLLVMALWLFARKPDADNARPAKGKVAKGD